MRTEKQILFWLAALLIIAALLALLQPVLLPFVVGLVIAYFLDPLAARLERLGLGRVLAAGIIVVGAAIVAAVVVVTVIPIVIGQLRQLAETLPGDLARLQVATSAWLKQLTGSRYPELAQAVDSALSELGQNATAALGSVARVLWAQGLALVNFLSLLVVTPLVVFYLLVDWNRMLAKIDALLPRQHAPAIRRLAHDVDDAVSAFVRGQGTICLILAVLYAAALAFIGLRSGILIGLFTGLASFVPFVGWAVGLLVAGAMALAQSWPSLGLLAQVVAVFAIGSVIDSVILAPRIVGRRIGLHPVWLIFALMAFSYLLGFVGTLIAVPVAAAIGVLVRFGLEVYRASPVYEGDVGTRVPPPDEGTTGPTT